MSTTVGQVVNVTVAVQSPTSSAAGFGIPLVFGTLTEFAEAYRSYTSQEAVLEDFLATTEIAKMTGAIFAQSPSVTSLVVGDRAVNVAQVSTVTVDTAENTTDYLTTVAGTAFSIVSDGDATVIEIATALVTAINLDGDLAVTGDDSAGDGTYTLTADVAGDGFTLLVDSRQSIVATTPNTSLETELDTFLELNPDWYALAVPKRTTEAQQLQDITQGASWVTDNVRLFVSSNDEALMITAAATDVASLLPTADQARTAVMYSTEDENYPEGAWYGQALPNLPGSLTWNLLTLSGITADVLTSAAASNLDAKNINYYVTIGGTDVTQTGKVVSGQFIDVIRTADWVTELVRTAVFALISGAKKIPYTQAGLGMVEGEIRNALQVAVEAGALIDAPVAEGGIDVAVPDIADVSTADKLARALNNVTFSGTLSGAVHTAVINGTLAV